jgi:hypothetical protein
MRSSSTAHAGLPVHLSPLKHGSQQHETAALRVEGDSTGEEGKATGAHLAISFIQHLSCCLATLPKHFAEFANT